MLTHKGTQIIETSRLILRPFTMDDARIMFDNWASDPEVTKYLMWPAHSSVDITCMVLDSWVKSYESLESYQWAIELKEIGQPIGSLSAFRLNEDVESAEIGYCIGKSWWHQGITTEALNAVIDFLFRQVGANRLTARHDPRNPHSGNAMKKCGMVYEGTTRQSDRNNQGLCDASHYAILRCDWGKK